MTLKVVVIDGNAISRNLLTTILTNGGYDIVGSANASSAGLASMIKLRPQLVCIDVGHEDDDGMQKVDTLRSELPKALVFMVSAKFDSDTVQSALQRGVRGFIVKPFNTITVLNNIRNTVIKVAKQHKKAGGGGVEQGPELE